MGKASPKDKALRTPKQRRFLRSSKNKYLKPGALAQLRYSKTAAAKSLCTDLGKKRVVPSNAGKVGRNDFSKRELVIEKKAIEESFAMLSPEKFVFSPSSASLDQLKQSEMLGTPKTPSAEDCNCMTGTASRLESLPMDLLVKIVCHLYHDQLRAVFHVSRRIRMAVMIARQLHFNYTTPDRSRQEMLRTMTPLPTEHWPFLSKGDANVLRDPSPITPQAPRAAPRPTCHFKCTEMKQVAAVLFQEPSFPTRCLVRSVLSKPLSKNRVLFYEDELCQAVAQNKLH